MDVDIKCFLPHCMYYPLIHSIKKEKNSFSVRTCKTQSSVVIVFYEKRSCRFQMEQQEISGM